MTGIYIGRNYNTMLKHSLFVPTPDSPVPNQCCKPVDFEAQLI